MPYDFSELQMSDNVQVTPSTTRPEPVVANAEAISIHKSSELLQADECTPEQEPALSLDSNVVALMSGKANAAPANCSPFHKKNALTSIGTISSSDYKSDVCPDLKLARSSYRSSAAVCVHISSDSPYDDIPIACYAVHVTMPVSHLRSHENDGDVSDIPLSTISKSYGFASINGSALHSEAKSKTKARSTSHADQIRAEYMALLLQCRPGKDPLDIVGFRRKSDCKAAMRT